MSERAVIIGGGLAGLAAASALAERGLRVTVLEARPRLGGRASSFVDGATGETIDNCQHVTMGCCTNFRLFCQTLGIESLFREERCLYFIGPDGKVNRWEASGLPAPLHLGPAFLRLSYLTFGQKLAAARALRKLARLKPTVADESIGSWLARQKQPPEVIERFWEVVLVSALSESLDRIDVRYARKVFVDGFMANREGWVVTIPNVPLDDIYGGPILDWLTSKGASVQTRAGVETLDIQNGKVSAAVLRGGERVEGDQFLLAVPHDRIDKIVPMPEEQLLLQDIPTFEAAPISSVHFWFDRAITDLPHAVFVGKQSQWLFRRTDKTTQEGHYYQVVVSASREFLKRESPEAIELVRRELAEVWPVVDEARVLHSRVVMEHKAVFSPLPGIDDQRPHQQTSIANLQIAGDWTATGWPATMEGAVRSGYLAAENVLERVGRPASVMVDDLRIGWLARLVIRDDERD